MTKSKFIRANPECSFEDFKKKFTKATKQQWYQLRYLEKKRTKKVAKKIVFEHRETDEVARLRDEIGDLRHQIIGFRAVVSYLEDLAGVRNSQ